MKGTLIMLVFMAPALFTDTCLGAETTLQKAWGYYLSGDYQRAVDACRTASKERMLGEEGRYIMGLSFLQLGENEEARKNFSFVLDNYPKSRMKEKLLLGVADSYYLENKFDEAQEYYLKLLKGFAGTDYASMAYLRLGICQRKLGKWEASEASFNKVVCGFPLSLEAEEAKGYLKEKACFFTVQVGAFSKESNAQKLCSLLKERGYDSYIDKGYNRDRLIYRVRVGKYGDKERSQGEAARLKKEGFNVRICT